MLFRSGRRMQQLGELEMGFDCNVPIVAHRMLCLVGLPKRRIEVFQLATGTGIDAPGSGYF